MTLNWMSKRVTFKVIERTCAYSFIQILLLTYHFFRLHDHFIVHTAQNGCRQTQSALVSPISHKKKLVDYKLMLVSTHDQDTGS